MVFFKGFVFGILTWWVDHWWSVNVKVFPVVSSHATASSAWRHTHLMSEFKVLVTTCCWWSLFHALPVQSCHEKSPLTINDMSIYLEIRLFMMMILLLMIHWHAFVCCRLLGFEFILENIVFFLNFGLDLRTPPHVRTWYHWLSVTSGLFSWNCAAPLLEAPVIFVSLVISV